MSESSSALRDGLEILASGVFVCLHDCPEWHAGTGYVSEGGMLLTQSGGGSWPRDAAEDTQASRQAKHCAHRGILIEQSVLGFLRLCNKRKVCTTMCQGMYTGELRHEQG